jgi:quinolinate synthase
MSTPWDYITDVLGDSAKVIPITYMNSAASLKAFVGEREGLVCTSSNARKTFDYAFERGDKVLFFPDQHLGRNTGYQMGIPLDEMVLWNWRRPDGGLTAEQIERAKVILWQGHCSTHQRFSVEQIEKARKDYRDQRHRPPECRWESARTTGAPREDHKAVSEAPAGTAWRSARDQPRQPAGPRQPRQDRFLLDPRAPVQHHVPHPPGVPAWVLEGLVEGAWSTR